MKASSLMIILGPLLLIGIIGLALHDTSIKNIKAGIYSEDADQEFLKGIQAKLIARSINSENYDKLHWCKEDVKNGIIQMCIELKPQKTGDMGEIHQEIVLHVDFSKQRTVWNIIGKIQGIVDDETTRYREEAIKNIKIELQNLKSESKDIESQLDNAINSLEEIKKYLQESADNGWTTKNRLENIKKEMSEIDSEINSLENVLITYSIPESSYSPELNSIKSSIAYTNEVVDQIESSVNTYNANNALTEVNQALNELENNKEKIIEMQNKAEKITNEDVDGIMNPIKLTHQSVLNSAEGNIQTNLEF